MAWGQTSVIIQIGNSLGESVEVMKQFDELVGLSYKSGCHTRRSSRGDLEKILHELVNKSKVITHDHQGRTHKYCSKFTSSIHENRILMSELE